MVESWKFHTVRSVNAARYIDIQRHFMIRGNYMGTLGGRLDEMGGFLDMRNMG